MKLGFIGAGQMARALAGGIVKAGKAAPEDITISDPSENAVSEFQSKVGKVSVAKSNSECAAGNDFLVLAVKPQLFSDAVESLEVPSNTTVVSVMGGITISAIAKSISTERVIRVMPNTPCLVGAGACAISWNEAVPKDDVETVTEMLGTMGKCVQLQEHLLDAVTGVSGSGPAYVFQFIQAMADGGVLMGLSRDVALQLSAQTVLGAAKMVIETAEHPNVLSDRVASPGGTTIHGLQALADGGMAPSVISAVEAATVRSMELGQLE